ncbi:unnamed protein product [Pedinophyceae sp. YPF-701]|nr:unnamed protein product [Pedinophyceae sp. YPF-701]
MGLIFAALAALMLLVAPRGVSAAIHAGTEADPCEPTSGSGTTADPYIFNASVDFFVSSTGYYAFDDCTAERPVLKMEAGKVYDFLQTDATNWLHPMGFAYYVDGAHANKDELEPGVTPPGSSSTCAASDACQSPMYYGGKTGSVFLGGPSSTPTFLSTASDPYAGVSDGGFGLDVYEPQFKDWSKAAWSENKYKVRLSVTDAATAELFYFCHLHAHMSGRILVFDGGVRRTNNGAGNVAADLPNQTVRNEEDVVCGFTPAENHDDTLGPSAFGLGTGMCVERHLCGSEDDQFLRCMEAIDCQMEHTMRVRHSDDPVVTFMRQMIPHHQNAVNMAKILLRQGAAAVASADAALGEDAFIGQMLVDIINGQNLQIHDMHGYLAGLSSGDPVEVQDADCAADLKHEAGLAKGIWILIGLLIGLVVLAAVMFGAWIWHRRVIGQYKSLDAGAFAGVATTAKV